ncbi:hypothetical protein FSARC_9315 [Fusarium sarcochroum]|uniref:EH domain-containing protein n=1 Tax=Fusarium sarcochroum TaxID=1208366 RepID=A0A8H4X602_9HYPO|nr:hypothetical protein FSARC_9315 [Fusarium sarcochroum]
MSPVAAHTTGSSDAAAALRGATLAFNKSKPAPPPPQKNNGALSAAASAGRRSPTRKLGAQSTGGSTIDNEQYGQNGGSIAARLRQLGSSPGQLHPSVAAGRTDPKSASFIAATLAASRSASPSPKARTPRRKASIGGSSSSGDVVDSVPIAPTGSLISMFEQSGTGDPPRRSSPKRTPKAHKEPAESISEEQAPFPEDRFAMEPKPKPKPKPKLKPKPRPLTPEPQTTIKPAPEVLSPKTPPQIITRRATQAISTPTQVLSPPTQLSSPPSPDPQKRSPRPRPESKQRPPTPPQPRGTSKPKLETKSVLREKSPSITQKRSVPQLEPRLSRRRPTPTEARPTSSLTVSSDDTFVSASSVQSPIRDSPPLLPVKRHFTGSNPPSPSRDVRRAHLQSSSVSSLPLESLTSAIVAGSLASARLTPHNTGGSLAPPLPRRQKSPRMMQTLRQPAKHVEEEVDRHKKKGLKLHKGKHAHHEGSRKKWRDEVTPRERKRYEAVWASNRGLLLDLPNSPYDAMNGDPSEYVLNTVVRDIWKRSRLPADELEEVWDLVDRKEQGVLGRSEFVVGMWLIDQRLRGRKIPAKVSDSVWGSANGMRYVKPK